MAAAREWFEVEQDQILAIYDFIYKHKQICDAHTVDFFTEDHWSRIIPDKWKMGLLSDETKDPSIFLAHPETMQPSPLKEFLCKAKELKLALSRHDLVSEDDKMAATPIDSFGMTDKKAHEVKKMASQVNSLAKDLVVDQVIDIGSGKGYLSEYLSFVHGYRVYGIDSSSGNERGALDRSRKVEKYFGKQKHQSDQLSQPSTINEQSSNQQKLLSLRNQSTTNSTGNTARCTSEDIDNKHQQCVLSSNGGFFKPLTHFIDSTVDILSVIQETESCTCNSSTSQACHSNSDCTVPRPSILVGLHTCGDLASLGLKQFVNSNQIRGVCVVGCCYHHITEDGDVPGFPMSGLLKSMSASLGVKARMLSCQSEGRFESVTDGKSLMSVFYRAVLQVVLRDELRLFKSHEEAMSFCVGRLKKYTGFTDYCRKAMNRLDISVDRQPTDEVLEQYYRQYEPSLVKVQRYLQVRAVIAPVIETLIILDRFLYLKEQKDVTKAWIVQLFSSTTSPRCIALCACK